MSEEAELFQKLRDGVFTVYSEDGKGSGFLIDHAGVVATNAHVIGDGKHVFVQLNDSLKVAAQVLVRDAANDIGVIRIAPQSCEACPVLPLSAAGADYAFVGERVFAIGSPLNQDRIMTIGVISKVESEALITDVNINHGNSGGPLINLDGEVVAINTFGDFSGAGGPGISGSISVGLLNALRDEISVALAHASAPDAKTYPTMPKELFPPVALQKVAKSTKWPIERYSFEKGDFIFAVHTPPEMFWRANRQEIRRSVRLHSEGDGSASPYDSDPISDMRSWMQYTNGLRPVVILQVLPRIGETTGSAIGSAFSAALLGTAHHTLEFKGDLGDFWLSCGDRAIDDCQRGISLVPLNFYAQSGWVSASGDDLARSGIFAYTVEPFLPTKSGWPKLDMHILDARAPADTLDYMIPQPILERIALDFDQYLFVKRLDTVSSLAADEDHVRSREDM